MPTPSKTAESQRLAKLAALRLDVEEVELRIRLLKAKTEAHALNAERRAERQVKAPAQT